MIKKTIVSALFAVVLTGAAVAQDQEQKSTPGDRHKGPHRMGMMQQLNLTDQQKAEMKSLNDDFRKQMTELKQNEDITVKEWKGKMETIRKEHHTKMQNILTPEQKASMEKMKQERKGHFGKKGDHRKGRMGQKMNPEKMKAELGLTDEQVTALKKNRTDAFEKMKAIRDNKSLTEEQKKAEMKQFREQQHQSLKSILTEEQLQKLQQHKPHRQKPVL